MSRSYQKGKNGGAYSRWRYCHNACAGQRQNNPWYVQEFQPHMHGVEEGTEHLDGCLVETYEGHWSFFFNYSDAAENDLGGERMVFVGYKVASDNRKEGNCRNKTLQLGKTVWKQVIVQGEGAVL